MSMSLNASAGERGRAAAERFSFMQTGRASWYGRAFQGRRTSDGEKYDMNALTCAHRSLPIGTLVRITNLRNRQSVVVRVNDRGPVSHNRIVDLSLAAARAVGLERSGTANVELEAMPECDPALAHDLMAQLHPLMIMPSAR